MAREQIADIIAVDPGGVHVGLGVWDGVWRRVRGIELDAEVAVREIQQLIERRRELGHDVVLVVESFSLYADKAVSLIGSQMETAQMIGALRYVAGELYGCEVVMQQAAIKDGIREQMRARGRAVKSGISLHVDDAMLHLWYYLLRSGTVKSNEVESVR